MLGARSILGACLSAVCISACILANEYQVCTRKKRKHTGVLYLANQKRKQSMIEARYDHYVRVTIAAVPIVKLPEWLFRHVRRARYDTPLLIVPGTGTLLPLGPARFFPPEKDVAPSGQDSSSGG